VRNPVVACDMSDLNVVHNLGYVGPMSFGPGQVAVNLAKEQVLLGCDARVWSTGGGDDLRWAADSTGIALHRLCAFPTKGPKRLCLSPAMRMAAMAADSKRLHLVHQHGLWTGISLVTNALRHRHGIASVLAPHGALSRWALNHSRWKKRTALALYEGQNLQRASCLHATAETEVADFRDFGLMNPIAVIGNGIPEESLRRSGDASRFYEMLKVSRDFRILLFLSRITPKKGLPMLVNAIKAMEAELRNWLLVIAGNDEFDHKREIAALVRRLSLEDRVRIIGPLFGQSKDDALAAADLFVLPSLSEGSPVVILDSLAAGVPVITTKACTWEDLHAFNCGWWVDANSEAIRKALGCAIGRSGTELRQMGQRGKDLMATKYTWVKQAQKTMDLYRWLVGRRERPEFVVLD